MTLPPFSGFPARPDYTAVPALYLARVMPGVADIAELKSTLQAIQVMGRIKGPDRYVLFDELASSPAFMAGLGATPDEARDALRRGLEAAVARGVLVALRLRQGGRETAAYALNHAPGQAALAKIERGEIRLPDTAPAPLELPAGPPPNIFKLYEQNIGLLTPMITEELKAAEKEYPAEWVRDAFREAVALNKRSWRYIQRVLEKWTSEGRSDGQTRQGASQDDPGRYTRGPYGHLVRH
jgi:DnaD/phage-associated family protein